MHLNNLKKSEYVQSNNFVNAFFNGYKGSNILYKIEARLYLPSILDKKIVRDMIYLLLAKKTVIE